MGVVTQAVKKIINVAKETVSNVPIVGQPAAEIIDVVSRPSIAAAQIIDTYHEAVIDYEKGLVDFGLESASKVVDIGQDLGILPGGDIELPEPVVPQQQPVTVEETATATKQAAPAPENKPDERRRQAVRSKRRRDDQQGGALGSILLAPSVLGTSKAVLGESTNKLG